MIKQTLFLITMLLIAGGFLQAQELLTIEQTLQVAYENSPDILKDELNLERSRQNLIARKAGLKAKFALDVLPFSYSRDRRLFERDATYYDRETMQSKATFSVVQPIKATDGTLSLRNISSWRNTSIDNADPLTAFENNVVLSFDQPIFTYNRTKLELQELQLDLENVLLNSAIKKLNIEKSVTQYFYNVYQRQQSLFIAREELDNQQKSFDIIKRKVDAGLSAKEELWQAELNLANAESSVYNSEVILQNAKDRLKQAIGVPLDAEVNVIANVEIKTVDVKMQDAIDYALKQRLEIRQAQIDIENSQYDLIRTNDINKFQGNVGLSLGLFGNSENLGDIYGQPLDNENVAVSFKVPIYDWGERKAKIAAAEASHKTTELNYEDQLISIELNIREIYRNLQNLVFQIEIAQKSVENAQKTYELKVEEYENGDLTSMDLSLYQNQLSNKKNGLTNALIDYKLELLNLKIQTLWDFERNVSIVPKNINIQ